MLLLKEAGSPKSVSAVLVDDYERIERDLLALSHALDRKDHDEAGDRAVALRDHLRRHFRVDKDILFEPFEKRCTPVQRRSVRMMYEEELAMDDLATQIAVMIVTEDPLTAEELASVSSNMETLERYLIDHRIREVELIHPSVEGLLDEHQKGEIRDVLNRREKLN